MLEQIINSFGEDEFIKADGFDEAVIGFEESSMRLIYSVSKCLEILEKDMSSEEAYEYLIHNVINAFIGEQTPIWCWDY
tara:strand:+ start:686 stop:922 length:237 start_codon:yes stop_codon:yes gene_type:complete